MIRRRPRSRTRRSIVLVLLIGCAPLSQCSTMIAMERGSTEPETEPLVYAGVRHHIMEADHSNECTAYFWRLDLMGSLFADTLLFPWTAAWALHIALTEDNYAANESPPGEAGDDNGDHRSDSDAEGTPESTIKSETQSAPP